MRSIPRLLPRLSLFCAGLLLATAARADIAFGHIVPLTGANAATGQAIAAGARAYIDEVNAAGGVAGQKIVHVVRDSQGQAGQTEAQAAMLIRQDHVFALLSGTDTAPARELALSGLLRQQRVPLLLLRNAAQDPAAADDEAPGRDTGLIEIAPPADYYAPLLNEYRAALARYGPAGSSYSSAGLQGYIAAKVMVGTLRLLGAPPTHANTFTAMRDMTPDRLNHLVIGSGAAQ